MTPPTPAITLDADVLERAEATHRRIAELLDTLLVTLGELDELGLRITPRSAELEPHDVRLDDLGELLEHGHAHAIRGTLNVDDASPSVWVPIAGPATRAAQETAELQRARLEDRERRDAVRPVADDDAEPPAPATSPPSGPPSQAAPAPAASEDSPPAAEDLPARPPLAAVPDPEPPAPTAGRDAVRDALEAAWPDDDGWTSTRTIAVATGLSATTVQRYLRELVELNAVEHNGRGTNASRHRLIRPQEPTQEPQEPAEEPTDPDPPAAPPRAPAAPQSVGELQAAILAAVADTALNVPELAHGLRASRDAVNEAVNYLVRERKITAAGADGRRDGFQTFIATGL